jgi:predicted transcriptional regulator
MLDTELLLSSKARLRVFETVTMEGAISITSLSRSTGLNHSDTDRAVRCLVEAGLLIDEYHGRNRVIKPDFRSFQVLFIKDHGVETQIIQ